MIGDRPITVKKLVPGGTTVTQNSNWTSDAIDLSTIANDGIFSLEIVFTSASTSTDVDITYLLSNNGTTFKTPASATKIKDALDPSSGTDTIYSFEPELAKHIKIKVADQNSGTVVITSVNMAVQ